MDRTRTHKGTTYTVSAAHPAADAFPWLSEDEIQELADDIRERGQKYKVVRLPDGRVIDGRNRELACRVAGVEPEYRTEEMGDNEVIDFVVSTNVHRRNLTTSQRAMAAAELANMKLGDNQHTGRVGTGAHPPAEAQENKASVADAAQKLDVSERSVKSAKKVKEKAPELVEAVKGGDLDVKTAAKVADLPKRERKKVAEAPDPKKAAKVAIEKAAAKKAGPQPETDDEGDPENPPLDPAFMPNAAEAEAMSHQFRNWVARLRAVRTELRKALPGRDHVLLNRIGGGGFDAALGELIETLDRNVPECVCPVCVGTGAHEGVCKFCDGYGIVDKHHHAGLKARWKHTRARLLELKGAA